MSIITVKQPNIIEFNTPRIRRDSPHPGAMSDDLEESEAIKKYPYPKSILFIISTEFCERFSFYGMKSK